MIDESTGSQGINFVFVFGAPLQMSNMRKSRGREIRKHVERVRYTVEHERRAKVQVFSLE